MSDLDIALPEAARDTTASGQYTEDQLVEQPAIKLFEELGWEHVNAYHETLGPHGTLGRTTSRRSSWSVACARPSSA